MWERAGGGVHAWLQNQMIVGLERVEVRREERTPLLRQERERVIYQQPVGRNPLYHREDLAESGLAPWEVEFPFPDCLTPIPLLRQRFDYRTF